MRIFLFTFFLLVFCLQKSAAQCDVINGLAVIDAPALAIQANMECTDANGWTHYFHSTENKLLLSIKKNGQNIGTIGAGLNVEAGTLSGYGTGAYNLSDADYIDNDVWIVANRFWQVTGANSISNPVQVRFYFHDEDVNDIAEDVDDFGFFVDEPDDLLMFTLAGGNGIFPLATVTQPVSAFLTLYDMVPGPAPDWMSGTHNGFHYSEFEVSTLDNGGGIGFLIFQQDPPVAVSGKIERPDGTPVPDVTVEAASSSVDVTEADGQYLCPTLIAGGNYEVVPSKDINHAEFISIADLIRLSRHLLDLEEFTSPYEYIAADCDNDQGITFDDLSELRKLLLGTTTELPNSSWRFVPSWYGFPNPQDPFLPPFPETIPLSNLSDSLFNQNFTGVKIGDVTDGETIPPPALNTKFSMPEVTTCNPGDEFELELTVEDFLNIRGFQFTLEWDSDVMEFLSVENVNLAGLTLQSIGSVATGEGKMTFAWFNPADAGSTVSNGTAICKLRFVATGDFDDATTVEFTSSITDILLLHQDLSNGNPLFENGALSIENNSLLSATSDVVHAGCNGEPIGSIDLSVSGGVPPISYEWSNGETTEDIASLTGGEYRVTVSDASGNCPKVFFVNVAPTGPADIQGTVTNMSCPSTVDGTIDVQVASGGGPYTFLWSNGETTPFIDDLFEGIYEVSVTDAAGCTTTASFEVENPNKIVPSVTITNASTATSSDGAVTINSISGGSPPFTFLWNNGETTQNIAELLPGDYIVTITDAIGCTHVYGYLVNDLMTPTTESGLLSSLNIFPNPIDAGQLISLDLRSERNAALSVTLLSTDGRLVSENEFSLQAGEHSVQLLAPEVSGLYFFQVKMDELPVAWEKLSVR